MVDEATFTRGHCVLSSGAFLEKWVDEIERYGYYLFIDIPWDKTLKMWVFDFR